MMPEQYSSSDPNDIRFGYEVIRNLAESVRQQVGSVERLTNTVADVQKTQVSMLERLARIEANRINEDVARNMTRIEALETKVDKLEKAQDYEAGMRGARKAVMFYWPAFAALGTLLLVILIATGIVSLPDSQKPPVVVPVPPTVHP